MLAFNRFKVIIAVSMVLLLSGCNQFSNTRENESQPIQTQAQNSQPSAQPEESDEFTKTGTEEMHICNAKAICHRGQVLFADGDVLTIVDAKGSEIEIEDSSCDDQSCFVEDTKGREWDLVWIEDMY